MPVRALASSAMTDISLTPPGAQANSAVTGIHRVPADEHGREADVQGEQETDRHEQGDDQVQQRLECLNVEPDTGGTTEQHQPDDPDTVGRRWSTAES